MSNSGNPIAAQKKDGKDIHVPAGVPGKTLEVCLRDAGSHWEARVADRSKRAQAQTASTRAGGHQLDVGEDIMTEIFDKPLKRKKRETKSKLAPREYPGKDHRNTVSHRHD